MLASRREAGGAGVEMRAHRGPFVARAPALIAAHLVALAASALAGAGLAGCASGGSAAPRGGDGSATDVDGGDDAAAGDDGGAALVDAGTGLDSGWHPPDASGGMDSGSAPADSGSGTVDAGTPPDAGARDAGCPSGATMSCTSSCGTIGVSTCAGGAWSACAPPAESCNDADDDCDGTIDDGFECRRGTSGACSTSCGSTGTRTCSASCGWGSCAAPAETCEGTDQDCDGAVDEGFRAEVVRASYASDLAPRHAPCNGTTQRMGPDCNAAMHRFCGARGCTTSGFGPDENAGDGADVTCVVASVRATSYTALSAHHAGCTTATVWGPDCNAAIHRYCAAAGFPSGYGPVEHSGDVAHVACVPASMVITTSYTTLATHHPGCNGTAQRMGPECNAAIHRFCAASGYVSGFGPVENSGDVAAVACVRR